MSTKRVLKKLEQLAALSLAFTFIFDARYLQAFPASVVSPSSEEKNIDLNRLKLSKDLGSIKDQFRGDGQQTVVVIQDAHAIPDAQKNIDRLIRYLQSEYGVRTVALEGAAAELDAQIFRSFPDQEKLKAVFKEVMNNAELAGGSAAAIFSKSSEALYFGVEDWNTYEKGIELFQQSTKQSSKILEKLNSQLIELNSRKKHLYSKPLFDIDQTLIKFHDNSNDFLSVLRLLAKVQPPAEESELGLLLKESAQEVEDFAAQFEVKRIASDIKSELHARKDIASRQALARLNLNEQEFSTSALTAKAFALTLKDIAVKEKIRVKVSKNLNRLAAEQKRMRDIQGTKLFDDFEVYAQKLKESLMNSDEERQLDARTSEIQLLQRFAKLELSREDWRKVRQRAKRDEEKGDIAAEFRVHFQFYENAEHRDRVMVENLRKQMAQQTSRNVVLVAGGFHSEGVTNLLRQKNISYALIMPQINEVPEQTKYLSQMNGEVSWGDYFEVESGKINLYKAFVRGMRDKLVDSEWGMVNRKTKNYLPSTINYSLLKAWRDQLIRDLAERNKIERASEYTQFIDEVLSSERSQNALPADWEEKFNRFIDGLKKLEVARQLTGTNIAKLLGPATVPSAVAGVDILNPRSEIRVDLMPSLALQSKDRSEVRSGGSAVQPRTAKTLNDYISEANSLWSRDQAEAIKIVTRLVNRAKKFEEQNQAQKAKTIIETMMRELTPDLLETSRASMASIAGQLGIKMPEKVTPHQSAIVPVSVTIAPKPPIMAPINGRSATKKRKKEVNPIWTMVGIVLGGVVGIGVALGFLSLIGRNPFFPPGAKLVAVVRPQITQKPRTQIRNTPVEGVKSPYQGTPEAIKPEVPAPGMIPNSEIPAAFNIEPPDNLLAHIHWDVYSGADTYKSPLDEKGMIDLTSLNKDGWRMGWLEAPLDVRNYAQIKLRYQNSTSSPITIFLEIKNSNGQHILAGENGNKVSIVLAPLAEGEVGNIEIDLRDNIVGGNELGFLFGLSKAPDEIPTGITIQGITFQKPRSEARVVSMEETILRYIDAKDGHEYIMSVVNALRGPHQGLSHSWFNENFRGKALWASDMKAILLEDLNVVANDAANGKSQSEVLASFKQVLMAWTKAGGLFLNDIEGNLSNQLLMQFLLGDKANRKDFFDQVANLLETRASVQEIPSQLLEALLKESGVDVYYLDLGQDSVVFDDEDKPEVQIRVKERQIYRQGILEIIDIHTVDAQGAEVAIENKKIFFPVGAKTLNDANQDLPGSELWLYSGNGLPEFINSIDNILGHYVERKKMFWNNFPKWGTRAIALAAFLGFIYWRYDANGRDAWQAVREFIERVSDEPMMGMFLLVIGAYFAIFWYQDKILNWLFKNASTHGEGQRLVANATVKEKVFSALLNFINPKEVRSFPAPNEPYAAPRQETRTLLTEKLNGLMQRLGIEYRFSYAKIDKNGREIVILTKGGSLEPLRGFLYSGFVLDRQDAKLAEDLKEFEGRQLDIIDAIIWAAGILTLGTISNIPSGYIFPMSSGILIGGIIRALIINRVIKREALSVLNEYFVNREMVKPGTDITRFEQRVPKTSEVVTEREERSEFRLSGDLGMSEVADAVLGGGDRNLGAIARFIRHRIEEKGLTQFAQELKQVFLDRIQSFSKTSNPDEQLVIQTNQFVKDIFRVLDEMNISDRSLAVALRLIDGDSTLTADGMVKALLENKGAERVIFTGNTNSIRAYYDQLREAGIATTTQRSLAAIRSTQLVNQVFLPVIQKASELDVQNSLLMKVGIDTSNISEEQWNPLLDAGESALQVVLALAMAKRIQDVQSLSAEKLDEQMGELLKEVFQVLGTKAEMLRFEIKEVNGQKQISVEVKRSIFANFVNDYKARAEISKSA